MTAVIVTIGIAVNSQITTKTSAALARVEHVQYPTVEALRSIRSEVTDIQESLQRAVAEGDKEVLTSVEQNAAEVRDQLRVLGDVDAETNLDDEVRASFDDYYTTALEATTTIAERTAGDALLEMSTTVRNAPLARPRRFAGTSRWRGMNA